MSRSFLLQDWTTVRSSLGNLVPVIQDPDSWLDLDGYSDVTCWIDIAQVTPPASSFVNLQLQTAPSADDAYFVPLAPAVTVGGTGFTQPSSTPLVVRSAKTTVSNNLMRYLRWNITPVGSGTWDLTFRIHAIAAHSTTFVPPLIPGCVAWFRADLGVSVTSGTSSVTGWNDQSGTNDSNKNLTTHSATKPTLNLADASYNGQPSITFVRASSTYMTSTAWANPLSQPDTWLAVGHTGSPGQYTIAFESNDTTSGQNVSRTAANALQIRTSAILTTPGTWGAPGVLLGEFNGSQSKIFFNNFTTALATGNVGTGPTTGQGSMTVGSADAAWGVGNYWDGPLVEIIAYAGLLSAVSKAQLRSYMRGRYGIAIG